MSKATIYDPETAATKQNVRKRKKLKDRRRFKKIEGKSRSLRRELKNSEDETLHEEFKKTEGPQSWKISWKIALVVSVLHSLAVFFIYRVANYRMPFLKCSATVMSLSAVIITFSLVLSLFYHSGRQNGTKKKAGADNECGNKSATKSEVANLGKYIGKPACEAIDEAFENMGEKDIFTLKKQLLDKESVKYFFSKLDSRLRPLELKLENCGVDELILLTLAENIPKGKVKILNLSKNEELDFSKIGELLVKLQCDSLDVSKIKFDEDQIKILGNFKVKTLVLNYATFQKSISLALAKLLKNGIEELSLVDGNISCEQLKEIAQNLKDTKVITLRVLDLSHIKLKKEGLEAISTIINKAKKGFKKLCLFDCGLDTERLKWFSEILQMKVPDLDVGCNEDIAGKGMQAVIEVASNVKVQTLDISSLALETEHIRELIESPLEIPDLNLSDNPEIEAADVGKLLFTWKTTRLNISECQFLQEDFEELVANMGSHKLKELRYNELSKNTHREITSILKTVASKVAMVNGQLVTLRLANASRDADDDGVNFDCRCFML